MRANTLYVNTQGFAGQKIIDSKKGRYDIFYHVLLRHFGKTRCCLEIIISSTNSFICFSLKYG